MAQILETLAVKLVLDAADFASGMKDAESKFMQVGQSLTNVGQRMTLGVTAPIVGIGVAALRAAADFEQKMNIMQQVSKATAADMEMLQKQALQLGKDTSFSAGEAAGAMLELAKAGMEVSQVSDAIPGVLDLAAAGGIELAKAAEISANAMNAFGLEASATTDVANMFAAAANASSVEVKDIADSFQMASAVFAMNGQSIDSLTASISLLGNAGIKGSDAGTSLKQMMLSLVAPTEKASKLMSSLGLEVFDSTGKTKDFDAILASLEASLGANATQLVQIGGATEEMTEAIKGKGQPAIDKLNQKLSEQSAQMAILEKELAQIVEKYGEGSTQADRKRLAIEKLSNRMAENRTEVDAMQIALDAYNEAVASGRTEQQAMTDATRAGALATIFGSDAVRAASILLKEGTAGHQAMTAAVNEQGAAQAVAEARMKGLSGAVEYFKGTLETVMIDASTPWLDQLSKMIRGTADLIAKFSDLPAPVQRGVVVFLALMAAVGPILVAVGTLITSIGAISAAFTALGPVLAAAGTAIAALSGPIAIVLAAITGLSIAWQQNWFGIRDITAQAWEAIKGYVQNMRNAFLEGGWSGLGRAMMDGIVNGIRSGAQAIVQAAQNAAQSALQSAKSALGIQSPSRVARDQVGIPFGMGIAEGIEDSMRGLSADVANKLNTMVGGISGRVSVAGVGGSGVTLTVNNTFNGAQDPNSVERAAQGGTLAALRQVGLA